MNQAITTLVAATLITWSAIDVPAVGKPPDPAGPTAVEYAVMLATADGRLQIVDLKTPDIAKHSIAITGLQHGEYIHELDESPSTGQLYGLTNQKRLVTINVSTGVASVVGGPYSLTSGSIGIDFNPQVDRIRVVGGVQNLRLSPSTGAVVGVDGTLAYAPGDQYEGVRPNVVAAAHARHGDQATLIGIDQATMSLVMQGSPGGTPVSPNQGLLTALGPLKPQIVEVNGLAIPGTPTGSQYNPSDHTALSAIRMNGDARSRLVQIDLATGQTTERGFLPSVVRGLAIVS